MWGVVQRRETPFWEAAPRALGLAWKPEKLQGRTPGTATGRAGWGRAGAQAWGVLSRVGGDSAGSPEDDPRFLRDVQGADRETGVDWLRRLGLGGQGRGWPQG